MPQMRNWNVGSLGKASKVQPPYQCKHDCNYLTKFTLLILCNHFKKNHFPIGIGKIDDEFLNKKIVNIFPSDSGLFTSRTQIIPGTKTPTSPTYDKNCGAKK